MKFVSFFVLNAQYELFDSTILLNSDYAKPYISTLIEADSFSLPKEKVTKGEIADIIVKTLKHLEML